MRFTKKVIQEFNVTHLVMTLPVDHEEDWPSPLPGRVGGLWRVTIDIEEGRILDWDHGTEVEITAKVVDRGSYRLETEKGTVVTEMDCCYVDMTIDKDGKILNWPSKPNLFDFQEIDA